jgi:hypothetical protein
MAADKVLSNFVVIIRGYVEDMALAGDERKNQEAEQQPTPGDEENQ